MNEHSSCSITFDILKAMFNNGDIVVPFGEADPVELSSVNFYGGDGYYFTKEYRSVKVYDRLTGQKAPIVGFGVDSDLEHQRHTERFIRGWKSSGLDKPRDYLDSLTK